MKFQRRKPVSASQLVLAFLLAPYFFFLPGGQAQAEKASPMKISSPAFADGARVPVKYTADGANISPPLSFSQVPQKAKSLALICDDPDAPAGVWVHWVIFNMPAKATGLKENVPPAKVLADGSTEGTNSFNKLGYGGPSPPPGKVHHYIFKLYALDTKLGLSSGASKQALLASLKGHVLAEATAVGIYSR